MNNLLFEFVKAKNTEFAYLLHGEWGAGKTYFIKEIFLRSITAENKYYVSLFGVSDIDQIYSQLITQRILGEQSGKVLRVSAGLAAAVVKGMVNYLGKKANLKASDVGVEIADVIPINDCIVVFDDLERVSEKADLSELLGQINSYFIQEKSIRVIFVADESKIEKDVYKKYKEKVVGFQSTLEVDLDQTLKSLISIQENENLQQFLLSEIDFIREMMEAFEIKNLRTIRYYFDVLGFIHKNGISGMTSKLDFLYSVFVLTVEEKSGRFNSIRSSKGTPDYISRKKGDESVKVGEDKLEGHFNKYIVSKIRRDRGYSFNYFYYESVFDIIRFGKLDNEKLVLEIQQVEDYKVKGIKSELMKLVEQLRSYFYMTNQEFISTYSLFIEELEATSSSLKFDEIVAVIRLVFYLQSKSQLKVEADKLVRLHLQERIEELNGKEDVDYYPVLVLSMLDREIGEISRYNSYLAHDLDRILKNLRRKYLKQEAKKRIENANFAELSEYDFRVFLSTASASEIINTIDEIREVRGKLDEFTRKLERTFKMPVSSLDDIMKDDEKERLRILKDELVKYQQGLEFVENLWVGEMINSINGALGGDNE